MKVRNGFVSNSSSCSFLVLTNEKIENADDIRECELDYGSLTPRGYEIHKALKTLSLGFPRIDNDLLPSVKKIMDESAYRQEGYMYFNENDDNFDADYEYMTPAQVRDELANEFEKGFGKEIIMKTNDFYDEDFPVEKGKENSKYENYEYRVIYHFEKWKEDLKNPKGYFRRALYNNVLNGLCNVEFKNVAPESYYSPLDNWRNNTSTPEQDNHLKKMVEYIVDDIVEKVLEYYGDCEGYFVGYCTDDGESNDFDYIAESQIPFRNFVYHIKYNNH